MSRNIHQLESATPSVVIIADEPAFGRDLMARWQAELRVPEFTLLDAELWQMADLRNSDLVVLGPASSDRLHRLLTLLSSAPAVLTVLSAGISARQIRSEYPNVLALPHGAEATEAVVSVAGELLARIQLEREIELVRRAAAAKEADAALGRYMIESRHSFNNALTSVLGNAELLQLDALQFSDDVREQIDTIHAMALRLHETMQRFSSLESEMQFVEKEPRRPKLKAMRARTY